MWIFLALLAVPLIEIGLFIQVGGWIGLFPTLATVVLTAVIGTILLRRQGIGELARLRASIEQGGDPTGPIANGAMILIAGVVLLTPGFFTDAIGFALLIPPVRQALIARIGQRIRVQAMAGMAGHAANHNRGPNGPPRGAPHSDDVIEGEFTPLDPEDIPEDGPRGASGWTRPDR